MALSSSGYCINNDNVNHRSLVWSKIVCGCASASSSGSSPQSSFPPAARGSPRSFSRWTLAIFAGCPGISAIFCPGTSRLFTCRRCRSGWCRWKYGLSCRCAAGSLRSVAVCTGGARIPWAAPICWRARLGPSYDLLDWGIHFGRLRTCTACDAIKI